MHGDTRRGSTWIEAEGDSAVAVLGLVAAACGGDEETGQDTTTTAAAASIQRHAEAGADGRCRCGVRPNAFLLFGHVAVLPLLPAAYADVVQRQAHRGGRSGGTTRPAAAERSVGRRLTWTFPSSPGSTTHRPSTTWRSRRTTSSRRSSARRTRRRTSEATRSTTSGSRGSTTTAMESRRDLRTTAVDDQTLDDQAAGDLQYRFTMPATAPIPPLDGGYSGSRWPRQGLRALPRGVGPLHVQGVGGAGLQRAGQGPEPVAGYVPGRSIELVRNPSWSADTDDLRLAYPDEIVTRSAVTTTTSTTRSSRARSTSSSTAWSRRRSSGPTRPTQNCRTG